MKRMITILLCLTLALSLFAGCRPMLRLPPLPGKDPAPTQERQLNAEEISAAALERLETVRSLGLDLKLEFSVALQAQDDLASISMTMELPGEMTTDPIAFHSEGTVTAAINKEEAETNPVSLYLFLEDRVLRIFTRSEEDERYQKMTITASKSAKDGAKPASLPAFAWELETQETRHLLSHTVTAEEAEQLAAPVEQAAAERESALVLPGKLRLDGLRLAELFTGMRLRMTVDRDSLELRELNVELSDGIKQLLQSIFDQLIEQLGDPSDPIDIQVRELRFVLTVGLHDYDSVAPILAPTDYEDRGEFMDLLKNAFGMSGGSQPSYGEILDELDDSYSLEDFSFRLREVSPRDFTERGWVVTDTISMRNQAPDYPTRNETEPEADEPNEAGADGTETEAEPAETSDKADEAAPILSEDGMLAPGGLAQIYLRQAGHEDDSFNPLRLGVVNMSEEPLCCLDCPIYFFSVNEPMFYEQIAEGMASFTGPAGIKKGMDRDQLVALLGEPVLENTQSSSGLIYLTRQQEELMLLLDQDGTLQAMFYQDINNYRPSDYVFHN